MVEDDDAVREALSIVLSNAGYRVELANDGRDALSKLHNGARPSAIVLDLMMPVMDGWQFRVEQKRHSEYGRIPVIALSASGTAQARAIDADEFLGKPVDASVLVGAVERAIERDEAASAENAEKLAALGVLAAGVAHEIGNPLTYVIANLELLRRELASGSTEPAGMTALVEDALSGSRRIAGILKQVQTVGRRVLHEDPSAVEVRSVVQAALALVAHQVRPRARLVTRFGPTPRVLIVSSRLEQVIVNLVINAAHAIEEGRADANIVEVSTGTSRQGWAEIAVRDTGAGIAETVGDRIFEPFFTTKPPGVGTGLGLPICRAITEEAGGRLEFESTVGQGTVFRVHLPPAAADAPPAEPPEVDPAPQAAADPAPRLRVLAIDDEPLVLRAVSRLLDPAHDVACVESVREALALIETQPVDVILCDLSMPDISGAQFLDYLGTRKPELVPRTIVMTGGAYTRQGQELVESGRCSVIAKPFSRASLLEAIDRVHRKAA